MFVRSVRKIFLVFTFLAFCSLSAFAQTSKISGTVNDTNGAAIVGATVKALNLGSGRESVAITNGSGNYSFSNLPGGSYRLSATANGFGTSAESLIIGDAPLTQNFSLAPGTIQDTVTVTAGKGTERIAAEVPQTVTVTTAENIEQRLPRSTFEAMERTPNLTVIETNPQRERPRLRGFSSTRVLIVIDGERLNNARFDPGASGPPVSIVDPTQLEAIEVLSGSGSSLYGSDAIGGTINLITKRPFVPANGFNVGFRLDGSYISNGEISRGNVTFNLGSKLAAFRGSFNMNSNTNYKIGDGDITIQENLAIGAFFRQFPTNAAGTTFQSGSSYPIFALPKDSKIGNGQGRGNGKQFDIWFFPWENHTIRGKFLNQDDDDIGNAFSGPPYETQLRYTAFRHFTKFGVRYEVLDINKYIPRASVNYFHQKLSFPQNQFTYANLNSTFGGSYVAATGAFTGNPSIFSANTLTGVTPAITGSSYTYNLNTVNTYGIDIQATFAPFKGLFVTVGGGKTKENSRDYFLSAPVVGAGAIPGLSTTLSSTVAPTIGASAPVSNYTDNNIYAQAELDRFKYVRVTFGVRRDNWVTAGLPGNGFPLSTEFAALNAAVPGLTANPQALTTLVAALPNLTRLTAGTGSVTSNRSSVTYSFGIVGRLPYGINPYFRWANSYREPGITERYLIRNFSPGSFFASLVVGNPNLLPEKGSNYDVGVKVQQKFFTFSLGYFRNEITDLLTFAPAQNYCVAPIPPSLPGSAGAVGFGCVSGQAVVSINARINAASNVISGWESTAESSLSIGRFGSLTGYYSLGTQHGTNNAPLAQAITAFNLLYNKTTTPIPLKGSLNDFPLANITPFRIIGGVQYLDRDGRIFAEYFWRHQNRVTRADPLSFIGTTLVNYGTFANLNSIDKQTIRGGYTWRAERYKFTFTTGVDNLTNNFFYEHFQTAPAPGRSFVFGLSFEWNKLFK